MKQGQAARGIGGSPAGIRQAQLRCLNLRLMSNGYACSWFRDTGGIGTASSSWASWLRYVRVTTIVATRWQRQRDNGPIVIVVTYDRLPQSVLVLLY